MCNSPRDQREKPLPFGELLCSALLVVLLGPDSRLPSSSQPKGVSAAQGD